MVDASSRTGIVSGSIPRIGTWAAVPVDFFGRSMITNSSAELSGDCPLRRTPGACLMTSTSGPPRPLVISLSAPLRITSARLGEPDPVMAAGNPAAIESTDTKTTTTPAMPMTATPDELRRCGIVRRLSALTVSVCRIQLNISATPQRFGDLQTHRRPRRQSAREQSQAEDQDDTDGNITSREHEDRQHAVGGIAPLHNRPCQQQSEATAQHRYDDRLAEHHGENGAVQKHSL